MSRERTRSFETPLRRRGHRGARSVSTQTFERAEVQRQPRGPTRDDEVTRRTRLIRDCCRKAVQAHQFRETTIDNTVWTETCGHYVTVKKVKKTDGK